MAPPPRPTATDHFFANNQTPIIFSTFALQVGHYQYIKRSQPVLGAFSLSIGLPRPLRAGLGWMAVFMCLMTKITLAKKTIRDYSDPVIALKSHRKPWTRSAAEGI
jgi:hypothetical protein